LVRSEEEMPTHEHDVQPGFLPVCGHEDPPGHLPDPVAISAEVWMGLEAVRLSGLTNLLDRSRVIRLSRELGFGEAANWVTLHPRAYMLGIFQGFRRRSEP
jgi:hypothetical protein